MLLLRARILVATFWAGSLWTIGYVVAPVLFSTLPSKVLAGTIAGQLFRIEAWVSVVCSVLLIASLAFGSADERSRPHKILFAIVCAMLVCTLIGYFGLQPMMALLREGAGPEGVMDSDARMKFSILHGFSAAFYLIQSLLGIGLILKIR
ncbi:MAG: hypothetical protein A3I66_08830 [Burkholderiales bacterium RIFCSPLOWO2_02_FULL_57_36]|nr:MAG: hypothetical protein A3I66_08830 [Burkholderiales bacterium RIFCSPLOWO2_02_FULL_57_36]